MAAPRSATAGTSARTAAGQWVISGQGTRWWFDPGHVAAELTLAGGQGNPAWEQWPDVAALTDWLRQRYGDDLPDVTSRERAEAIRLRGAVIRLLRAAVDLERLPPRDVDALNTWAARPTTSPWLEGGTRPAPVPSVRQGLASIAAETVRLLADQPAAIRECAADDCRLVFVDLSRSRSRTWCSMQRCGNRAKVRRHRQGPGATGSG